MEFDLDAAAIRNMIAKTGTNLRTGANLDNIQIYKDSGTMNLPRGNYNEDNFISYLEAEALSGAKIYFFEPGKAAPIEMKGSDNGRLSFSTPNMSPEPPAVVEKPSGWKRFANWITRGSAYKADFDAYTDYQAASHKWEEDRTARVVANIRASGLDKLPRGATVDASPESGPEPAKGRTVERVAMTPEELAAEAKRREERNKENWEITEDEKGLKTYTSKKENAYGGKVVVREVGTYSSARPSQQRTPQKSAPEKDGM